MRIQNKPTRGIPLTQEEQAEKARLESNLKMWAGGPRFIWVSQWTTAGSKGNSGTGGKKKSKSAANKSTPLAPRPLKVPRWARRKYGTGG